MRKLIVVLTGLAVLIAVNYNILAREKLLTEGRVVLLELAPIDPRSLMQGDYMALRFKLAEAAFQDKAGSNRPDGQLVIQLDERSIGSFQRIADGTPLANNEALLRYRIRNDVPKFSTNAFFFQEGQGKQYEPAKYGEFRVAANGDMILTALRDANLSVLGRKEVAARTVD